MGAIILSYFFVHYDISNNPFSKPSFSLSITRMYWLASAGDSLSKEKTLEDRWVIVCIHRLSWVSLYMYFVNDRRSRWDALCFYNAHTLFFIFMYSQNLRNFYWKRHLYLKVMTHSLARARNAWLLIEIHYYICSSGHLIFQISDPFHPFFRFLILSFIAI